MNFSRSEARMWEKDPTQDDQTSRLSNFEIDERYVRRELRIITETNREQLPNFVSAMKRSEWMNLSPFYQRRRRWDEKRKSKLIESFIMGIPVPPCFIFESDYAKFEVMDGQQRISAIVDFYENRFELVGLTQWPELNGRRYDQLPEGIQKGLDRRSISYIIVLKESASTTDNELLLRQQVFERLNTGGVELSNQEVRHCIYHSEFEKLLIELSRSPILRRAFGLPTYSDEESRRVPEKLLRDKFYSKMEDVEFVLRFFAIRHYERYSGGMQTFLDRYMVKTRRFNSDDLGHLRGLFNDTLRVADEIFEAKIFRSWDPIKGWSRKPQVALADAILVGISENISSAGKLVNRKAEIQEGLKALITTQPKGTFTGQGNTKAAVRTRIQSVSAMFREFSQ